MSLLDEKLNIDEFKKLEQIVYAILDNFPEEVERITQAIKETILSYFEDPPDKLLLAGFIQDIIACYFGDKLTEDFIEILGEEINEENLH